MMARAQVYKYKGNRCASCGIGVEDMLARYGTFDRMFEFHHVDPTGKDRHYKRLMAKRLSRSQLDEIDKCVLLCGQCHSIIHAQHIVATLDLSVQLDQRMVKQSIKGWARFDKTERSFTFVSNQPYLLHICQVRVGTQAPTLMCLIEIESKMVSEDWIGSIERHKSVEVQSLQNRRHFMRIQHIEQDRFTVTQSVGLPLTMLEFHPTDKPKEILYLRNGFLLTASGEVRTQGEITLNATLIPTLAH